MEAKEERGKPAFLTQRLPDLYELSERPSMLEVAAQYRMPQGQEGGLAPALSS